MEAQPYLIFNGRSEEAVEFYRKALGAEIVTLKRFKEVADRFGVSWMVLAKS